MTREQVDVSHHLPDRLLEQSDFPDDVKVEYQGRSRIFEVREVECDQSAKRSFTLDGGLPSEWLAKDIRVAILSELSSRMMAIPRFEL